MNRQLIGVLGGTFDPVHLGHIRLANEAVRILGLDALRCVPAGNPPHRPAPIASAEDRLAMARLAFADQTKCTLDNAEIYQPGPSWTILTLERLRAELPEAAWVLLVGADAFRGLPTWHRWQELTHFAHLAVVNRPGTNLDPTTMPDALQHYWHKSHTEDLAQLRTSAAGKIVSLTMPPCPISATQVRAAACHGQSISGLVPVPVENYIRQHHLYT